MPAEHAREATYSLLDILVHALDAFQIDALECPYCTALALRRLAEDEGLSITLMRRRLTWKLRVAVPEETGARRPQVGFA